MLSRKMYRDGQGYWVRGYRELSRSLRGVRIESLTAQYPITVDHDEVRPTQSGDVSFSDVFRVPLSSRSTFSALESRELRLKNSEISQAIPQKSSGVVHGPVRLISSFLSQAEADQLFELMNGYPWQRNTFKMYGKESLLPRDELMYGDSSQLSYSYSGRVTLAAQSWPCELKAIRDRIAEATGYDFPMAIGNRYQSGRDSIGWHSDDEPEMGERPAIVSLSLGATRKFKLRHKVSKETIDLELGHGSLLIMEPGCQEDWLHCVPKTKKLVGPRINWTFRPHAGATVSPSVETTSPSIEVINVRDFARDRASLDHDPNFVYVGRKFAGFDKSPLCNEYRVSEHGLQKACWLNKEKKLKSAIRQQSGQVYKALNELAARVLQGDRLRLGCWCVKGECLVSINNGVPTTDYSGPQCHAIDVAKAVLYLADRASRSDR